MIPPASTRFFSKQDYDVFHNPRTHIVYDDARHFLLTTTEKYDIIASDPLDVFVKGTAALYSQEYFEEVKRHLNPGGYFSLYVPLYETDERTICSELETFFCRRFRMGPSGPTRATAPATTWFSWDKSSR